MTVTVRALAHATTHAPHASRAATLHGFSVAFWWSAGFFGFGAILSLFMLQSGNLIGEEEFAPAA